MKLDPDEIDWSEIPEIYTKTEVSRRLETIPKETIDWIARARVIMSEGKLLMPYSQYK